MSSLLTELHTADMPAIYRRFADVIDPKSWTTRAAQMKGAIKQNRFLEALLRQENEIAFGLDRCSGLLKRYGALPNDEAVLHTLYPALGFAAQSLSLMDLATPIEADRLRRRIAGTFRDPSQMRGLRLELSVATHFARRNHVLQWPEMTGGGTFDLLVADLGRNGLEVECKSISSDNGRRIHRREALEMHHLVVRELRQIRKTLRVGLVIVLTVPGRLPTNFFERQTLARQVRQQIAIGRSARLDSGVEIRISEFDVTQLGWINESTPRRVVQEAIKRVSGTENRECLLTGTEAGGALVFVVQSARSDDFLEAVFDTLGDAARRQLSGERPALLIAGFDELGDDQLTSIAQQDSDGNQRPTALAIQASSFLNAAHRNHVIGAGFLSGSSLRPTINGATDSGGAAYYFPKRESTFWQDDFSGLFRWRTAPPVEALMPTETSANL